jgi:two-component system, OmpR family, phosphate regulon sensor histidine kinase PhoR
VAIPDFLLGLLIGVVLLIWQRVRLNARLKQILQKLQSPASSSPFPLASQVSLAIAQQRRDQAQLRQEIDALRYILQSAPVAYLQVDDENRLLWCNSNAGAILGINPLPSWPKPRLLLELVRSYELDDLIEQTRNANQICQSNWTFYPTSADPTNLSEQPAMTLQGYGLPLSNNQVGVFLENRQEIAALIQQRDRWTSDLAHELKTPLTSIRLVAETLQTRLDPSLRTWVDRLINETVRLSTLVQDMLDLSQMQRGSTRSLQLSSTDLVHLIHSVWHSLEPLARRKHLNLDYRGPKQLLMQLDEARIYRLLINLLDNSIKYSPVDQPIRVKLTEQEAIDAAGPSFVCLEVIDYGPGFPEKALPQVFERFYRADPSRSRLIPADELAVNRGRTAAQSGPALGLAASPGSSAHQLDDRQEDNRDGPSQGGSGLGLSIVRQIVEAHQGSVSAGNHFETGGAWLQVRLPRQQPS